MAVVQKPIHIGQVVRNAIFFNFKNSVGRPVNEQVLLQSVDDLLKLLEGRKITYVLVGGIALLQYIEGRNTEDINLIVALSALKQLPEVTILNQDDYLAQGKLGDLKIDFLLTKNRLFQYVQQNHTTVQPFEGQTIPCATVEGLLLLKLYALPSLYRQGNFDRVALYEGDILMLLRRFDKATDTLFIQLKNYLSDSDLASLKQIVEEIEARIARFSRGF